MTKQYRRHKGKLEILKSLGGFYDGLVSSTSVIRLHISSLFLPRRSRDYTIIVPCYYHSLFLAPFLAGDIKYFRIGGGVALGGGNILSIFSPYLPTHLLVTRQMDQNFIKIC